MSASRAFAAHTINSIPATTVAMVYSCATSLVSFKITHIKLIAERETALSIKIEDINLMHELQVSMGVPLSTNIVTRLLIIQTIIPLITK